MSSKKIALILLTLLVVGGGTFFGLKYFRDSPAGFTKRADSYFEEEKYNEARIEYQNVLREEPQNAHAIRQIGLTWVNQGSLTAALPFLAKTVELDPEDLDMRWYLAANWKTLGNHDAAEKEAREILDRDPKHERAILLLANSRSKRASDLADFEARLKKLDPDTDAILHVAQATRARLGQDVEGFKSALAQAQKLAPESLGVLGELIVLHAVNKDQAGQIETLKKLSKTAKPRTPGRLSFGVYLAQQQKNKEALAEFERIIEESSDYFPALLHLADLRRRDKDFEGALDLAGRVIATDPAHPEAPQIKAQVLFDQGKTEEAIKALEDLVIRTGYPATKFVLARIYLAQGKLEKGRARLVEVLEAMPGHTPAALTMAQLQIRTGEADEAETIVRQVLELEPTNTAARILLANSFEARGNNEAAEGVYREWTKDEPTNPGPFYALSKNLRVRKAYDQAFTAAQQAVKLQPTNTTFRFNVVEIEVLRERYAQAQALAESLIAEKDIWQARLLLGRVFSHQKKWEESRAQLFKALELQPGALAAYELLVGTYLAEGKPESAITELQGLIKANPKSSNHHLLLALLHEKQEAYPQAAVAYENMLKQLPNHPQALNNLAYIYAAELNKLEAAEKLARESVKRSPEHLRAAAIDTLGWILYQRGKFAEAHPLLERAAQALPDVQEIQFHLGMARIKMGMLDDATSALQRATTGEADYRGKELAKQELAALRDPTQRAKFITEDQLKARIAQNPSDAEAHLLLAGLYREAGRYEDAVSSLERATKVNPRLVTAWVALTELYGNQVKNLDKAVAAGRAANRADPGDSAAAGVLGKVALQRGKPGDLGLAYRMLKQAVGASKDPSVRSAYALSCYLRGLLQEARKTMQALVTRNPPAEEMAAAKSFLALTSSNRSAETLPPLIAQRLEGHPSDIPALMAKASIQPNNAKALYEQVLQLQPDFALARLHLGLVLLGTRDSAKAEEILKPAFAVSSDTPLVATAKGALAYRKDDPESAIRYLGKQSSAEALVYLGLATIKSGLQEKGAAILTQSLKMNPPAPLKKEAQDALGIQD